jgi:hypothetical protein
MNHRAENIAALTRKARSVLRTSGSHARFPGDSSFAAVATAAGIYPTSAVVHITVVSPVAVFLSGAQLSGWQFSFNCTADPGLTYVVQSSTDLVNWTSLQTNVATGNPVLFLDPINSTGAGFYRIGRLPNL